VVCILAWGRSTLICTPSMKFVFIMQVIRITTAVETFLCFKQLRLLAAGQNNTEFGESGWYKEQFEACDRDNDGLLNVTEFNEYVH
jgi:hypothetical protein